MERSTALPVVLNSCLGEVGEIARYFTGLKYKVKISQTTEKHSIIFPKSSFAVKIFSTDDICSKFRNGEEYPLAKPRIELLDKDVLKNLERFAAVNRKCYLVLLATRFGQRELAVFTAAQHYFSCSNLKILFAHSAIECVECMSSIANATLKEACVETRENITERMKRRSESNEYVQEAMMCAGIRSEDVLSVHQGCGSLANFVTAGEDLLKCTNLDQRSVEEVVRFFGNNSFS